MVLIFLTIRMCVRKGSAISCSKSYFGIERTGQRFGESQSEGESRVHVHGTAFVWMLALFVCCGEWGVSLDEAACPKGVQSVLGSETV